MVVLRHPKIAIQVRCLVLILVDTFFRIVSGMIIEL